MEKSTEPVHTSDSHDQILCIDCETPNARGRKFCASCGQSLTQNCPKCEESNAVNVSFCGNCGADLTVIRQEMNSLFETTTSQAKSWASELDFNKALSIVNTALGSGKIQLKSQVRSLENLAAEYRQTRDEMKAEAKEQFEKASFYYEKKEYSKCLKSLQTIPEAMRNRDMVELFEKVSFHEAEKKRLTAELNAAVSSGKYLDALPSVERLLGLQPDDAKLQKLESDIQKMVVKKTAQLKAAGKIKDAQRLLQRLGDSGPPEAEELKRELSGILWLDNYVRRAQKLNLALVNALKFLAAKNPSEASNKLLKEAETRWEAARQKGLREVDWAKAPDPPAVGPTVSNRPLPVNIDGLPRLGPGLDPAYTVAVGLALQGVQQAKLNQNLAKKKKTLFSLGGKKKSNAAWGIDFGNSSLKAVQLVASADGSLRAEHHIKVPYRTLYTETTDHRTDHLECLLKLKSQFSISKKDTLCVNLGSNKVLGRFIRLPNADDKAIQAALKYEVKVSVPFQQDQVVWDQHVFPVPVGDHRIASVIAARTSDLETLQELFAANDLSIEIVQADPIAIYNLLSWTKRNNAEESIAVLDIGFNSSNFCVVHPDHIWFRSFGLGGDSFNRGLAREFKLNNENAEKLKLDLGKSGEDIARAMGSMSRPFGDLFAEVRRSLQGYESEFNSGFPAEIHFVGGGSQTDGLLTWMRHGPDKMLPG